MGQEETRIIRRGGNHGEEDGGEGLALVTTPSKAIDVGLPLTLNSLTYETGDPSGWSAGVEFCRLVSRLSRMHVFSYYGLAVRLVH